MSWGHRVAGGNTIDQRHFTQGVVGRHDGLQLAVVAHFNFKALNA